MPTSTNTAPNVKVVSVTSGSMARDMQATTPLDIAQQLDISLADIVIFVDDAEVKPSHILRENDFVSFQRDKTTSGR